MLNNLKRDMLGVITLILEGALTHFSLFLKVFAFILLTPIYTTPEQVVQLVELHAIAMIAQPIVTTWIANAFESSVVIVAVLTTLAKFLRTSIIHNIACDEAVRKYADKHSNPAKEPHE